MEEQERKQRALLQATELERMVRVPGLQRPEDAEFQLLLAINALKLPRRVYGE
jgi:hypothetical protein